MVSTAAIILAAGKGTRMKSDKPKVCFELAGKPLVERVCNSALAAEASKVVVVVGYKKELVENALPQVDRVETAEQTEQLGTGHAVLCTRPNLGGFCGDVLILCGDVPLLSTATLEKLLAHHRSTGASCTVLTGLLPDAGKYGRIVRTENGDVEKIVEYRDADEKTRAIKEFNTGIYCFKAQDMFAALDKVNTNNDQNEYYLTDTLAILRQEGKTVQGIVLDDPDEALGVNSHQQLAELEVKFYRQIRNYWLNNGVQMENPDTAIIGEEVFLGHDVYLESGCILKGRTRLGNNVHIGPYCLVQDAEIANGCELKGYNIVINSRVRHYLDWQQRMFNVWPLEGDIF